MPSLSELAFLSDSGLATRHAIDSLSGANSRALLPDSLLSSPLLFDDSALSAAAKLAQDISLDQSAISKLQESVAAMSVPDEIIEVAKLAQDISLDQSAISKLQESVAISESGGIFAELESISKITKMTASESLFQKVARLSEMEQARASFNIPPLGSLIREDVILSIHAAEARSIELASICSASTIADHLRASAVPFAEGLPVRFQSYPSMSVALHDHLVRSFEHGQSSESDSEADRYRPLALAELLPAKWMKCLVGAKQAIESSNPDKQRHALTSIRELMTAVLHYLAPNEKVKLWIPENRPDFLHNKQPTRKCRLTYICRNISSEPLDEFVALDIDTMHQFYLTLNGGTHSRGDGDRFTDQQVRAIIGRAEGFLLSLLQLSDG